VNRKFAAVVIGAALASAMALSSAMTGPVDEKLVIDDQEMITRAKAQEGLPFDEVLSGWLFREAETRELEADSFQNPGMLYVERGEEIWNEVDGTMGKSCASCHNDAAETMQGIAANYPKWDADAKRPINIELQIDKCRVENMGAEAYKFDADEQKALTTFIKYQSLGDPVKLDLSQGELQSWWERGKENYYNRTGQLNLACASCHEANAGNYIRADHLSQGQSNGFPTYRLKDADMVSLHGRFRGCVRDTRAETPKAFSDDLMALELYVTWRGTGLSVETPSVRH
jgi:L-cysteine S-thiosulfotransferase